MEDNFFCKECQEKFDRQQGELLLVDMCKNCRYKSLMSILEVDEKL